MSEQLHTTNPDTNQGQLFDPNNFEHLNAAQKEADINQIYSTVLNPGSEGQSVKDVAPLSDAERQLHVEALSGLMSDKTPDGAKLPRDWSNSMKLQEMVQADHEKALKHALVAKLKTDNEARKIAERRQEINSHNDTINNRKAEEADIAQARTDHEASANKAKNQHARQAAKLRREFIARKKLELGEGQMKLFKKEVKAEADAYVLEQLGELELSDFQEPERQHSDPNVIDTKDLKEHRWDREDRQEDKAQESVNRFTDFYKGFNQDKPEADAAQHDKLEHLNIKVSVGEASHKEHGEDTILRNDSKKIFGVFDGLGGHINGEKASKAAADAVEKFYAQQAQPTTVEEAIDQIKAAMDAAREGVDQRGMGGSTTAVFTKLQEIAGKAYMVWANAGDSRLFLQKGTDKKIMPISTDQASGNVVFNGLFPGGRIDRNDPDEFGAIELDVNDRIMICSDGITGDWEHQFLSEEEMQRGFDAEFAQESADLFLEMSKKDDDKSVLIIDIVDLERQGADIEPDEPTTNQLPVLTKKSFRDRLKNAYNKAKFGLAAAATGGVAEASKYFGDKEKGGRRKASAVVLGVLAVGAAAYGASKLGLGHSGNHNASTSVSDLNPSTTGTGAPQGPSASKLNEFLPLTPKPASSTSTETAAHVAAHLNLKSGDNIWNDVSHYLNAHGYDSSNASIDHVSDSIRHRYGISEFDARHLPVGFGYDILDKDLEGIARISR